MPHLLGDHTKCLFHKETDFVWQTDLLHSDAAETLYYILFEKITHFGAVIYLGATHQNESFHREQLVYGNQKVFYPQSQ